MAVTTPSIEAWTGAPKAGLPFTIGGRPIVWPFFTRSPTPTRRSHGAPMCCFNLMPTFAAGSKRVVKRADVAKLSQAEFGHQPGHRRLAIGHVQFRPLRIERRIFPPLLLGRQSPFVLRANVFRVQILGARIQAAQIALAAELRADHVRLADQIEPQAAHGRVRLDRMAQQPARAKFRAKTALVAGGCGRCGRSAANPAGGGERPHDRRAARSRRRWSCRPGRC